MEAVLTSTAVVALAEIGDKTMLLAIVLATRFRKPLPIILGILIATLANHGIAAFLGQSVASILDGELFRLTVGGSFVVMALWTLVPDKLDDQDEANPCRFGAFLTTTIRSEEHTSELQSIMRISYAVFCLKKKNTTSQTV